MVFMLWKCFYYRSRDVNFDFLGIIDLFVNRGVCVVYVLLYRVVCILKNFYRELIEFFIYFNR